MHYEQSKKFFQSQRKLRYVVRGVGGSASTDKMTVVARKNQPVNDTRVLRLANALAEARRRVGVAIDRLRQAQIALGRGRKSKQQPMLDDDMERCLRKFFHLSDYDNKSKAVATALAKFRKIRAGLAGAVELVDLSEAIQDENDRSDTRTNGYVNHKLRGFGRIHLDFLASELKLALVIIHEASHKFCDTKDWAYYSTHSKRWRREDGILTHKRALDNADSFALFAMEIQSAPTKPPKPASKAPKPSSQYGAAPHRPGQQSQYAAAAHRPVNQSQYAPAPHRPGTQ